MSLKRAPQKPRVMDGKTHDAWWYENERNIEIHVEHDGGHSVIHITRHVLADWLRARWRLAQHTCEESDECKACDSLAQCDNCGGSGWHTEYGNDGVPCGDSPCDTCNPNGDALREATRAAARTATQPSGRCAEGREDGK